MLKNKKIVEGSSRLPPNHSTIDEVLIAYKSVKALIESGNASQEPKSGGQRNIDAERTQKVTFASLFKDNRTPDENSILDFVPPSSKEFCLEYDEIDTVENALGYCLVGCIMGRFPGNQAIMDLTKKWGRNVKFHTHSSGWITFIFPNEGDRDKILYGGPHFVQGKHLFLKLLPRYFLFKEEDMHFMPVWVQIHGLRPDCWTNKVLSIIASVIGKPIHTDKLTLSKQRTEFARVLIEVDASKTYVKELPVKMPTGQRTVLEFSFEFELKFCSDCKKIGHATENCKNKANKIIQEVDNVDKHIGNRRLISSSIAWRQRTKSRGRSCAGRNPKFAPLRQPTPLKIDIQREENDNEIPDVAAEHNANDQDNLSSSSRHIDGALTENGWKTKKNKKQQKNEHIPRALQPLHHLCA